MYIDIAAAHARTVVRRFRSMYLYYDILLLRWYLCENWKKKKRVICVIARIESMRVTMQKKKKVIKNRSWLVALQRRTWRSLEFNGRGINAVTHRTPERMRRGRGLNLGARRPGLSYKTNCIQLITIF